MYFSKRIYSINMHSITKKSERSASLLVGSIEKKCTHFFNCYQQNFGSWIKILIYFLERIRFLLIYPPSHYLRYLRLHIQKVLNWRGRHFINNSGRFYCFSFILNRNFPWCIVSRFNERDAECNGIIINGENEQPMSLIL